MKPGRNDDDDDSGAKPSSPLPKDLSPLSIGELREYIAWLEAEIVRARSAISAKEGVRTGAESLFRR